MKRFLSKKEYYIPLKVNGVWRTAHFVEVNGGFAYNSTDDEESGQIMRHPYFEEGMIRLDESEQPQPRRIAETPEGQRYYDKRDAMDRNMEIIEGVGSCSDARSYLRERFPDDNVLLRSKRDIVEYAQSKNIYFSEL